MLSSAKVLQAFVIIFQMILRFRLFIYIGGFSCFVVVFFTFIASEQFTQASIIKFTIRSNKVMQKEKMFQHCRISNGQQGIWE